MALSMSASRAARSARPALPARRAGRAARAAAPRRVAAQAFAPWEFGFVCPDLNPECWGKGEYIGSAVNIIMCNSIAWPMFAGRYGLAPTERRTSGPIAGEGSLAYTDQGGESIGFGVDPAGFTIVDVIALASLGHVLGAGTCAGLAAIGQI